MPTPRQRLSLAGAATLFSTALLSFPARLLAQTSPTTPTQDTTGLDATAREAGLNAGAGTGTFENFVGRIIESLLGFTGIIFLILMVYGGILWMTAAGDDAKVIKARKLIVSAVIGLIIIIAAFAFTEFVLQQLQPATSGFPGGGGASSFPPGSF